MAGREAVPSRMGGINSLFSTINLLVYFHTGGGGCRLDEVTSSNSVYQVLKGKISPVDLAHCLHFEHQDIENLKEDTRRTTDLLSAVLDKWFKGSPPPACWETIVDAVKCTNDKRLASEIERQHTF